MKSNLDIQIFLRDGISQLGKCFFSPPFKIMNITEDKQAEKLDLMLMSSSPGILDEDEYVIKIDIEEGCSLQLHTQSYQRLFNMKKGATQSMEVTIQNNASFIYLPHPAVPHENSIFTAKNRINLSDNCYLIFGEILTCGRKLNGEVFQFSKYHNITEVFVNNKLIIKENLMMQPSLKDVNAMGQMEGYTHQASFIYINESIDKKIICDQVYEFLLTKKEIAFGVSLTHGNGILVRLLGYKAEQLYDYLKSITTLIQKQKIQFAN